MAFYESKKLDNPHFYFQNQKAADYETFDT